MQKQGDFTPKPYSVYCTVNGKTHRVGPAATEQEAAQLILDDQKEMDRDHTMGGLFERRKLPPRYYHVFRAEWTRIDL